MTRPYDSESRRAAATRTRHRILDAAIEILGRPGGRLQMRDVAAGARVSLQTVYTHFRTRDALLTALRQRVAQTAAKPPMSTSVEELRDEVPALHEFFQAREGIVRAMVYHDDLAALRAAAFEARDAAMQRALAASTSHLSSDEEAALRALLVRVMAAPSWLELKDRHHLPDDVITRMTNWAVRALLDRLTDDATHASRAQRRDSEEPVGGVSRGTAPGVRSPRARRPLRRR